MLIQADNNRTPKFLTGGSELTELIKNKDWSLTPLGAIDSWPQSLKTSVNLILNSQHPMWIGWGREMTFLYNDAYVAVLGDAKHPSALGCPAPEVWNEIWDVCGPLAEKVFTKGQPTFLEDVQLFMNRGEYTEETYYSFSYSPIYDEEGNVAGLFCPSAETTSKVLHARRLLTLSELSSKALIEKSTRAACASAFDTLKKNAEDIPFAILYLIDSDRMIAHLEADTRLDADKVSVQLPLFFLKERQANFPWPIKEVFTAKKAQVIELDEAADFPPGSAGEQVSEAIVLPVMSSSQGMPIGILIAGVNPCRKLDADYFRFYDLLANQIATAIQNAHAVEEERKRAEMLAEIDRAKTAFFSNVSHEFRTPLTLMLGPLEATLERSLHLLPGEEREGLKTAHRNTMRLLRLVNTLLDFSRIEAGRVNANFSKVNLAAVTEDLASNFRSLIEKAGMQFHVDCAAITTPVFVDIEMWEKIVFNLLSNAYKYTVSGTIAVHLYQRQDLAVLEVEDTGVGIPANELPMMFDRFHRIQNTKGRTFEGTGIGLSLVKELIALHKGSISVESKEGVGSKFTVEIPLGKAHLPVDQLAESPGERQTSLANMYVKELESLGAASETPTATKFPERDKQNHGDIRRTRVLVVDDNADMRNYIVRLLEKNYEIDEAENGKVALDKVDSFAPDLVLTDIMMPVLDGVGLLHALKNSSKHSHVPVIFLSARAGEESRIEGYQIGADDYLVKPFAANELMARVRAQIRISKLRRNAENHLRNFFQQAPLIIVVMKGPEFIVEVANERLLEYWQKTAAQTLHKPLLEILPEVKGQGLIELLTAVLSTGKRHVENEREVPLVRDGKVESTYVSYVYEPLHDEEGNVTHVMVVANEVTESVLSRKRIEASESKFRNLVTQAPVGIAILRNPNFVVEIANETYLQLANKKADELVGKPFFSVLPELNDSPLRSFLQKVLDTGEPYFGSEFPVEFYRNEKLDLAFFNFVYQPLIEDNHVNGVICVVSEVTEIVKARKIAEELATQLELKVEERTRELKISNSQLELSNRELEQFAYVASHDLQEPLRKIQTFSELLQRNLGNKEHVDRYVQKIETSAGRMSLLIRDVLNYSRLSRVGDPFEQVDLNVILNNVKADFELRIQETNATIMSDKLPVIKGIALQLHQLFSNLIGNSLKFTNSNPVVKITCKVLTREEVPVGINPGEKEFIRLSFIDNGIGFEQEYAEKLFVMFQRLRYNAEHDGTGIGLAICKKIVANHGGFINGVGELNKGATFNVYLPV